MPAAKYHLCLFVFLANTALTASGAIPPAFTQNKGQWDSAVHYRIPTGGGYIYLDQNGLTIDMLEPGFFDKLHDRFQSGDETYTGRGHVLKIALNGADLSKPHTAVEDIGTRQNYYIGNDPSHWASDVRSYAAVSYPDIYPNIDLVYHVDRGAVKYDYWVRPGGDPNDISTTITGGTRINVRNGNLIVETSVGEYGELKPFAYQTDEYGAVQEIPCEFRLKGETVSFRFPEGYDHERLLVIDPEIAFSSYVGSVSDNFGFTASYDEEGNLYAGAIVFGSYYPITAGAYEDAFGGGSIDCGITKFSSDGTQLLYSTFFGGAGSESPHSMVVNDDNELYVLGSTSSNDLPVFDSSLQNTFGGGTNVGGIGFNYTAGSDIFVARFSADGTALLSSTYLGGSGNDGVGTTPSLNFNYGDIFRGEIVLDQEGFVYIGSVSTSNDFPIVGGFSNSPVGNAGGVVCKLNPELTEIVWSTFTGGSTNNAVYGIQIGPDQTVYVTGGTGWGFIPGTDSGAQPTYGGGSGDGFIQRISSDGSTVLGATFCGTYDFDQNYFVQLDTQGNVFVVGQSRGDMPISDGVYSNPNSKQFIQKYTPDLSEMLWGTQVGSGSGQIDISPSAFLVTNCDQIYLSGWGGSVNSFGSAGGNTFGLPITPDAFQETTDGSDFYLMVLDTDASDLVYGTYFGGSQSFEHVDGGTSRFDKDGTVYQAVCAGCGGNDDFPTQPGVWSQTNDASNCNLGVFKFKLASVSAVADFDNAPLICPGETVDFLNLSSGADTYHWDFGDGQTSTEEAPSHTFDEPGTYEISLFAEDSHGCLTSDSTSITVEIQGPPQVEITEPEPICPGESVQLEASGADEYLWTPANGLSANNVPNPTFTGEVTTTYTVSGTTACGTDEVEVTVEVGVLQIEVTNEVTLCPGESFTFDASGGTIYSWTPATYLDADDIANPTTTPPQNITYQLTVSTDLGCEGTELIHVEVLPPPPTLTAGGPYTVCNGNPVQLFVSGGGTNGYEWSPSIGLSDPAISNPMANPQHPMTYTVTSSNECGTGSAEIVVKTSTVDVSISTDTIVCYHEPFFVEGTGAVDYRWQPAELFANSHAAYTAATISRTQTITLTGYNEDGCHDTQTALVRIYPREPVNAGPDGVIAYGDEIQLHPYSTYPIVWENSPYLSCLNCMQPMASPLETGWFYATILSPDGCVERDSVKITVRGNIYVPNAFTPNGDGKNDIFKAQGVDIVFFKIEIFDRWGERVFQADDIEQGWSGKSPNEDYFSPPGVYPYRIVAREHGGDVFEIKGHVVLIR